MFYFFPSHWFGEDNGSKKEIMINDYKNSERKILRVKLRLIYTKFLCESFIVPDQILKH